MGLNLSALTGERPEVEAPRDPVADAVRKLVRGRSREELLLLAGAVSQRQAANLPDDERPRTPDELWHYIKDRWGIVISRTPVCEGHDAPFDFVWLAFFEVVPNLFEIAARGSGKSFKMSMMHELFSEFFPGCETVTFGAVDEQSRKVYDSFVEFFLDKEQVIGEPTQTKTVRKNGSKNTCFPATIAKVNGPHPSKVHSDEVEIMREAAWRESRNMAADKIINQLRIKATNLGTSTRKWKNGRVDKIFQKFLKAKQDAVQALGDDVTVERVRERVTLTAPFYVVIHCIFESSEQVTNCRSAPENATRPDEELCNCNLVVNGKWDDGQVRSFDSVCRGRLYRARGHRSLREVQQLFLQNDRRTWEAQQECTEAEAEGLYIPSFSRRRHGLASFPLDISNGPCYTGTDWGFTNPAAVEWVQYLERPVLAMGYDGRPKTLPRGARVFFSELYEERKTDTELGQLAIVRELKLAQFLSLSRLPVRYRWADLQGAGGRRDWTKMGLPTRKYTSRNFDEHVKEWRGLVDADRCFFVVDYNPQTGIGCPVLCDQIEGWRADELGNEVEADQHTCSAGRYVIYGMHDVYHDAGAQSPDQMAQTDGASGLPSAPGARPYERATAVAEAPNESWRGRVGATAAR